MARYPVTLSKWALGESFPILVRPIDRLIAVAAASPGALNMVVDAVMVAASTFVMAAVGTVDDAWHALKKQNVDGVINALLTGAAVVPATALGLVAAPIQGWIQASRFLAKAVATTEGQPHDPVTPTLGLREASSVTVDVTTAPNVPAIEKASVKTDPVTEDVTVDEQGADPVTAVETEVVPTDDTAADDTAADNTVADDTAADESAADDDGVTDESAADDDSAADESAAEGNAANQDSGAAASDTADNSGGDSAES